MRILVTGAMGTLGRVLVRELRERGNKVWGCDLAHTGDEQIVRADVAEYRQLRELFADSRPEAVYHLAAEFGRMNGENYYEQLWRTNCLGTRNVIECCRNFDARLIFASSSEAYGMADAYAPEDGSFREEWLDKYAPDFHNEYALTKWANERQIRTAARNGGLRAMILRFFNAYGPGEYYTPYRSVVCLFCYRMMFGLPITVYKGYRRTFMWVGDWVRTAASAAQLFDHASAQWVDCRGVNRVPTFNLGGEEMLEVQELRDRIAALLGYGSPYAVLDAEKANVVSKRPDNELAKILLGHSPTTTLAYGLPRTLDWMREVYDTRGRLRDPAWAKIGLERIWRTNSSN